MRERTVEVVAFAHGEVYDTKLVQQAQVAFLGLLRDEQQVRAQVQLTRFCLVA